MPDTPSPVISRILTWLRQLSPQSPRLRGRAGGPQGASPQTSSTPDPYRPVILVLLAASLLGTLGALVLGNALNLWPLLDAAVTLGLSTGILIGVAYTQNERANVLSSNAGASSPAPASAPPPPQVSPAVASTSPAAEPATTPGLTAGAAPGGSATSSTPSTSGPPAPEEAAAAASWIDTVLDEILEWFRNLGAIRKITGVTSVAGLIATAFLIAQRPINASAPPPTHPVAALQTLLCLIAVGMAATGARYLADVDPILLPEGAGLRRLSRVLAWSLFLVAISPGLALSGQDATLHALRLFIVLVNVALCVHLLRIEEPAAKAAVAFPLDFAVLSILGSRMNVLASVLDSVEQGLGIDLRSSWALTVVRHSLEPLILGLCLIGWLSTCLTVVGVQERGIVERLGIPWKGEPLLPGLHAHLPWPVDQVFRIPAQRVMAVQVGHEGEEGTGPENVLWAVEHAPNEYTLLLGNGRDLITVDATVQYRITDALAWRYHSQNPAHALRAIAYRAVMRSTVNRTLSQALSENLATLAEHMRDMVQRDADALGLGVKIIAFTVGGMHPPVPVASEYEGVVSAQVGKVTAVVGAQADRNRSLPFANATALENVNRARAQSARNLALAAGEAWGFRTLQSQYRADTGEYIFRRRLETLEAGLADRHVTIIDSRLERDGAELWLVR